MKHFLYVFSEKERDTLLSLNYKLLKADMKNKVFIFENKEDETLSFTQIKAIPSDVLTF